MFNLLRYSLGSVILSRNKNSVDLSLPSSLDSSLRDDSKVFLFAGSHKSMWETTFLPPFIHKEYGVKLESVAGAALFSKFLKPVMDLGVTFGVNKQSSKSSLGLVDTLQSYFSDNRSVVVFPEKIRSRSGFVGDFKPASFEAVFRTDKEVLVVPFDFSYPYISELDLLLGSPEGSLGFKLAYTNHLVNKFDKVSVSFGDPLYPKDFVDRKEMSSYVRDRVLDLVKVYPSNVVAASKVLYPGEGFDGVSKVLDKFDESRLSFSSRDARSVYSSSVVSFDSDFKYDSFYFNQVRHLLE